MQIISRSCPLLRQLSFNMRAPPASAPAASNSSPGLLRGLLDLGGGEALNSDGRPGIQPLEGQFSVPCVSKMPETFSHSHDPLIYHWPRQWRDACAQICHARVSKSHYYHLGF